MSTSGRYMDEDVRMDLIVDYLRATNGGQSANNSERRSSSNEQRTYSTFATRREAPSPFVAPIEVIHKPGMDARYPPTPSKFTLPAIPKPKRAPPPRPTLQRDRPIFESLPLEEEESSGKCDRTEFWYEQGKEWNVKGGNQKRNGKKDMDRMQTGPECFTCGNKLRLEQLMSEVPCDNCGCFN
ncbi:uncharacterized protein F4812DRAFT_426019 [Daldinia caldariorum]|uniref:uncharacterized protein n=1 Tax=Daldinia caldariorum TaxID=326644 RepID=UPI00200839B2|nr:uncharacterized protein F4812DRAFT_426019 [Daldinia caldariorum]KAI1468238.1 hypothetical protein F4812DRAFT_426019 [Daldinia caldariorum]